MTIEMPDEFPMLADVLVNMSKEFMTFKNHSTEKHQVTQTYIVSHKLFHTW